MINKKDFVTIRKKTELFDKLREQVIIESRGILKKSKSAIYDGHRGEIKSANNLLLDAKGLITKLNKIIGKDSNLATVGAYTDALEEYVEASCYVAYLEKRKIPNPKKLGVTSHIYLQGVCDLVGELVRLAVNSAAKGDYKRPIRIKEDVSLLYSELMLFNWRNSPARRKFDSIKYGLEKLEDLALKIKFKQ